MLPLISRPHPGPAAAAGGLARRGCSPRALCYPDPRARLLQARRGSWPGGCPAAARRTDGPAAVRRPVAAYSWPPAPQTGGQAVAQSGPQQLRPAVITCAQAQLIMLPAVLHLPLFKHHTSTTFLHSPHDALPLSPYASFRLAAFRSQTHFVIYRTLQVTQSADYPLLLLSALVQQSELCPPSPPAVPVLLDVFSAERGAYLGSADFLHALPRPGRATRSSTLEPSPAGAGTSPP